ncbi:MAG: glycosyl hydrolase family 18 protein, partial [Polyangia bacterium]
MFVSLLAATGCSSRSSTTAQATPVSPGVGGNGVGNPTTMTPPTTTPPTVADPADGGTPMPDGGTPMPDGGVAATPPANPPAPHRHCAWISDSIGISSFVANADFFDAIHPVWFSANADGTVRSISGTTDNATIISTARAHHVALIPLVYGGDDPAIVRAIFASPAAITAHVNVLTKLVVDKGYDGLDLDYEHLWIAADRPGYSSLVTQLAAALHKAGKTLTAAVSPAETDFAGSAYDLPAMVASGVDLLHLMGYDYHYQGGDHLGPLAPIGWIDSSSAYLKAKGIADRALLGIANYSISNGGSTDTASAISQCIAGSYSTTTNHMATCPYGARVAGVSPHCTTASGDVWFEDKDSVAEKVA